MTRTDIDMPGSMDGIKLAHAVRERWPPVKLIVNTGRMRNDLSGRLPFGVPLLTKPYSLQQLGMVVGSV